MHKIFPLRHVLQIPQQKAYTGVLDEDIKILSKNFEIHNALKVKEFLGKNSELILYINRITPLINNHFPDYKKCITFCQDPEFDGLDDITIYINSFKSEFDNDWMELDGI